MKHADFDSLLCIVRSDMLDVRGCTRSEIANEVRRLRVNVGLLCAAKLARKSADLESRRRTLVEAASELIAVHGGC